MVAFHNKVDRYYQVRLDCTGETVSRTRLHIELLHAAEAGGGGERLQARAGKRKQARGGGGLRKRPR